MSQSDRMAMMGHDSAAMTMHYTVEDLDRRRRVLEQIAQRLTSQCPGLRPEQFVYAD